jgi:serine/threonine protein kinase
VATEIISEVIDGLKYLIKLGVLHRDLKPANILNNKKNWKIADFGFAICS